MKIVTLLTLFLFTNLCAIAGGAGENALLIVNADSVDSKTIANHYAKLRNIPREQIVYLSAIDPKMVTLPVEEFRTAILAPIFKHIASWKLSHIDYIIYSSGFPTNIDCIKDAPPEKKYGSTQTPTISLTSATFYAASIQEKNMDYMLSGANHFYNITETPVPFNSSPGWIKGAKQSEEGQRFYLSFQLGEISTWASTKEQIIEYLSRAKSADFSQPKGTFYFTETADVRSKTRLSQFAPVIEILNKLGYTGEIVKTTLPTSMESILGATIGIARFDWKSAKSSFIPGAIGDNLTSYGGIIKRNGGQTTCAKLLNEGAAGACGTVVEPYALSAKFPHSMMHVHYVKGANLAESMYATVRDPYQLLMLGDALCRPFTKEFTVDVKQSLVEIDGIKKAQYSATTNRPAKHFHVYIDGIYKELVKKDFHLDPADITPGAHEIRIVAVADDSQETCASYVERIFIRKNMPKLIIQANKDKVKLGETVAIKVSSRNLGEVSVYQNTQLLGKTENGVITVEADTLGVGQTEIYGMVEKGGKTVRTAKIDIEVTEATTIPKEEPATDTEPEKKDK